MKLWLLPSAALAMRNDSLEINPMTTPGSTILTSTAQTTTTIDLLPTLTPTPTTIPVDFHLDSDDKKVTAESNVSNDFYENGLAQISSDWSKILAESNAKSSKNDRLDSKFEKIIENLEEKNAENSANDKLNFPYVDGTFLSATKNNIDPSKPCDAIDALANDIKQWTMNFIEGVARPCGKNLAKTSCYSPPGGALKGQEINKKWHKRTLQFVKQTNQRVDKIVTKFKNSQQCKYCIRVTSSADPNLCKPYAAYNYLGGGINFIINGEVKDTLARGFTEFEYCSKWDEIDIENDKIQLQSTSTDGVCITSLSLNDNQILVGKLNDRPSFWIDGDPGACLDHFMSTPQITFKNGEVLSSFCKGIFIILIYDNSLSGKKDNLTYQHYNKKSIL